MAETPTVPNTLLEAVNIMLSAVGQGEVMSLSAEDTNEETQKAVTAIGNVSREVQGRGWHFNTEENLPLSPDPATGFVQLPANLMAFSVGDKSSGNWDLTQRGGFLYDRRGHTLKIGAVVYADVTLLFEFMDIPPPIRWYITTLATRRFAVGRDPDAATYKFTKAVEDDAWAEALSFDTDARGTTLVDTSPYFRTMRGQFR